MAVGTTVDRGTLETGVPFCGFGDNACQDPIMMEQNGKENRSFIRPYEQAIMDRTAKIISTFPSLSAVHKRGTRER